MRIIITGPESSGKTTLAEDLGAHFGLKYIPEYARPYLDKIQRDYTRADLDIIATKQFELQDQSTLGRLQICDTGPVVMKIWSLEIFGGVSPIIQNYLQALHVDLYLLCLPDIPWVADHLRVNSQDRDRLFDRYIHVLLDRDTPVFIVSGSQEHRLERSLMAIACLLP